MKYLFNSLPEIKKKLIAPGGLLLMLDFDGTLSPIALTPARAFLPKNIKRELQKCSRLFPVVIVSGRALSDIKGKVGLEGLAYAGNHGLEWQIGKKVNFAPAAKKAAKQLTTIKPGLKKISRKYPGVLLEDKYLTLAIHYRRLSPALVANFKKEVAYLTGPIVKNHDLKILKNKKAIELGPDISWDKGKFALFIQRYFLNKLKTKLLPVYIGDDATDEDAFLAMKTGITVRVGRSKKSCAEYYIKNPGQAALLLRGLCKSV